MSDSWYFDWINPASALKQSLIKGDKVVEFHHIKDIVSTKLSQFSYKNIERIPSLTTEILEMALLFSNFLCFYNSPTLGWGLYRYTVSGELDRYLRPIKVNLITLKGTSIGIVDYKDIIIARDNRLDMPPFFCIYEYLIRLQKIDAVIFKTLDISSLPLVLAGTKKLVNQYKQIVKNLTGGDPIVAADDSLVEAIKAFKIDIPVQPNDTYILKQRYRNECLASIGILSVEDKRERILKGEQMARNSYVDAVYNDMKKQRLQFIEALNKADPSLDIQLEESRVMAVDAEVEETKKLAEANNVNNGGNNNDNR